MFENPGDELFFGEVYRQILQEAWLPEGSEDWYVVGQARRATRPTQQGVTSPNLTPDQEFVRRWFQSCASAWRELPWEFAPDRYCDNRWDRKYWKVLKDSKGVMCSYYDLYMRNCLAYAFDNACLPPSNYLLLINADLSAVACNAYYPISCPNLCGHLSLYEGPGSFSELTGWLSPKCGTEGDLCFIDENGSLGPIHYIFAPEYWCDPFTWPDTNPIGISQSQTKDIVIEGGVPPFTWQISGSGFTLDRYQTTDMTNKIIASGSACGPATITVTDSCFNQLIEYVLCDVGRWSCRDGCEWVCGCNVIEVITHYYGKYQWSYEACSRWCEGHCGDVVTYDGYTFTANCTGPVKGIGWNRIYEWIC